MESCNGRISLLFTVVILCSVPGTHAGSHSLIYFYLHSVNLPDLPAFSWVGMLDDLQIDYYDSSIEDVEPRQQWVADRFPAEYWIQQKEIMGMAWVFAKNLNNLGSILGIRYFQGLWGCTQSENMTSAFIKFSIQNLGEINCDIITLKCTGTGVLTMYSDQLNQLDANVIAVFQRMNTSCIENLPRTLQFGKAALERKVAPEVVVLKREPTADEGESLLCLITPFYPRAINAIWLRNGEVVTAGIKTTVLPNHDETYRMELLIELQGKDSQLYSCQVQHSSLSETLTLRAGAGGPYEALGAGATLGLMAALAMIIGAM